MLDEMDKQAAARDTPPHPERALQKLSLLAQVLACVIVSVLLTGASVLVARAFLP